MRALEESSRTFAFASEVFNCARHRLCCEPGWLLLLSRRRLFRYPPDPYGRETPRSLASGLVGAFASGDYRRAAQYLEFIPGPKAPDLETRAELAQQLQRKLDSSGSLLPFASLSSEPAGVTNDGLSIDEERLGAFRTETGERALMARRLASEAGTPYWVVSADHCCPVK